jgi:hypothetical protein
VFAEVANAPLRSSVAILSQLRLLNGKGIRYEIRTVPADAFASIKEKTRRLLALFSRTFDGYRRRFNHACDGPCCVRLNLHHVHRARKAA